MRYNLHITFICSQIVPNNMVGGGARRRTPTTTLNPNAAEFVFPTPPVYRGLPHSMDRHGVDRFVDIRHRNGDRNSPNGDRLRESEQHRENGAEAAPPDGEYIADHCRSYTKI